MEEQLNTKAKIRGQRGLGPRLRSWDEPNPALQKPPSTVQALWGDSGCQGASQQADRWEYISDCYIECIIRGEFSDPILDEDMILKSFTYLRKGSELVLSEQVLPAGSPPACSWQSMREGGAKHQPALQLLPGERPRAKLANPNQFAVFARSKPRNYEDEDVLETLPCPHSGCGRELKNKNSLRKHLSLVHGPRNYMCAECGKAFPDSSKLKRHFMVHTGEKPFPCTFQGCGKRFALAYNLRTHVRIHTGEKCYVCVFEGCQKRFVQSSNLRGHLLTHTKPKKMRGKMELKQGKPFNKL